jgi:peptide deformylase
LRTENAIITEFDENLKNIAKEMLLVMYASDGVGLAAPQVGINKRLMVFNELADPTKIDKEMILVNPRIVTTSSERAKGEEGCLSFPQIFGDVERFVTIDVEYQDVQGTKLRTKFENRPAIIFQHEYDHLEKILFIDHLSKEDQEKNRRKLDKLIRKYGPGGAL